MFWDEEDIVMGIEFRNVNVPVIDPSRVGSANSHKGSLVGQEVIVTKKQKAADFKTAYPKLNPQATYTITSDNEGKTLGGSGLRGICFKDNKGNQDCGPAARFDLASDYTI